MQLHRRAGSLEEAGIRTILVTFSAKELALRFRAETGVRFPVWLDPTRSAYVAYGLERSAHRTFTLRTIRYYASAMLRGERLRPSGGDPYQLGGDFLVDARGVLRFSYRSADPADRPSVDLVLEAASKTPSS